MKRFNQQITKMVSLGVIFAVLGGCAVTSVFTSYPREINKVQHQIDGKQFKVVQDKLDKQRDSADKILYMMERGRTSQIGNDNNTSITDYKAVMQAIRDDEDKAIISASDAGANAAALLTNDSAIPYVGDSYEHIFLHNFQAMNYLFNNDLDAATVEVRRANEGQQIALNEHDSEIAKAESDDKGKDAREKNKGFMSSFADLETSAGKVKNSFQNAYTFYVSAIIYELNDKPNDAYIDYKKAWEIFPSNPILQKDVIRLAKSLSMKDDLARYKKTFKVEEYASVANGGELIILFEHGFAPPKLQIKIPLITLKGTHSVAFPIYAPKWIPTLPLAITDGNSLIGSTHPIVYVQALAAKALQEKLPGMMIRQVLRVVAKKAMADKSGSYSGLVTAFNFISEKADLRSWLTLPNDAQIYRTMLSNGDHNLKFTNGRASGSAKVKIAAGKKTILRVISTGKTLHTKSIIM